MTHRLTSPFCVLLLAGLLGSAALPSTALAQQLPTGISSKPAAEGDRATIDAWVNAHFPKLSSDDVFTVKAARDAILQPFKPNKVVDNKPVSLVSASFRKELAASLNQGQRLKQLAADKREFVAVNALRLAGEIGHATLVDILVTGLSDSRSGVQYAALYGIRQMLENAQLKGDDVVRLAITSSTVKTLLDKLIELGKTTADPRLLDGVILAIDGAINIPVEAIKDARAEAIKALSTIVTAQCKLVAADATARAAMLVPIQRATSVAQNVFTKFNSEGLPAESIRPLLGVGADALALCSVLAGSAPTDGAAIESLAQTAENIITLGSSNMNSPIPSAKLTDLLKRGDLKAFLEGVAKLLGPAGRLLQPPFSFPAERFKLTP